MSWAQTVSGNWIDLLHPQVDQVLWPDVAEQLAKQPRYCGATRGVAYGVAQHSLLVVDLLPRSFVEAKPYALLHDAHEAVLGDWVTPFKLAMQAEGGGKALRRLESRMARVLHEAAGLVYPPHPLIEAAVHDADLLALATEKRDLLAPSSRPWDAELPAAARIVVRPMPWPDAADRFLTALKKLCPEART